MIVHIYRTNAQLATDWYDTHGSETIKFGWPSETELFCSCCRKRHKAINCIVYSYYDGPMVFCAEGRGCKDTQVIAEKIARNFRNRSAGQKARRNRILEDAD